MLQSDSACKELSSMTEFKWHNMDTISDYIDFTDIYMDNKNKVIHVIDIVNVKHTGNYNISTGSDDGFKMWVNGDSVAQVHIGRACNPDDDIFQIKLNKGLNHILYKIDNGWGGWALYRNYNLNKSSIDNFKDDLFIDLPESCIIEDSLNYLNFNTNKVLKARLYSQINPEDICMKISWISMDNFQDTLSSAFYYDIPDKILLDEHFKTSRILLIQVYNNNKISYTEKIPIYTITYADSLAKELYDKTYISPILLVKKQVIGVLFNLVPQEEQSEKQYSTRMKAHILNDLYGNYHTEGKIITDIIGPVIMGYRSRADSSIQLYRVYIPDNISKFSYQLLYHIPMLRPGDNRGFIQGTVGHSHKYMSSYAAYSTLFNTIIVTPYGRGELDFRGIAEEDIPEIHKQIKQFWSIDEDNINFVTFSTGIMTTPGLVYQNDFKVKNIYGIGIYPGNKNLPRWNQAFELFKINDINIHLIHGVDDNMAPISVIREWKKLAEKVGLVVTLKEIKNADHHLNAMKYVKIFISNSLSVFLHFK